MVALKFQSYSDTLLKMYIISKSTEILIQEVKQVKRRAQKRAL